jgi:hypothetical protein
MAVEQALPASDVNYPEWQPWYRLALLELNRRKLPTLLQYSKDAIYKRLRFIQGNPNHAEELQVIHAALATLENLKRHGAEREAMLPRILGS